jgi:hypothetical protein
LRALLKTLFTGKEVSLSKTCQTTLDIIEAEGMINAKVQTKAVTLLIFLKLGVFIRTYFKLNLKPFYNY